MLGEKKAEIPAVQMNLKNLNQTQKTKSKLKPINGNMKNNPLASRTECRSC